MMPRLPLTALMPEAPLLRAGQPVLGSSPVSLTNAQGGPMGFFRFPSTIFAYGLTSFLLRDKEIGSKFRNFVALCSRQRPTFK